MTRGALKVVRTVPRFGLASWVSAVALAALLPLLAFATYMVYGAITSQQAEAIQALQRRAAVAADDIAQDLQGVLDELQVLTLDDEVVAGDLESMYAMSARIVRADARLAAISVSTRGGAQLFNTQRAFGTPLPTTPVMKAQEVVFDQGTRLVLPLVTSALSGGPVVGVVMPVDLGPAGRAAVRAVIPIEAIGRRLNADPWPADWTAAVIDQRGIIVARSHDATRFVGRPANESLMQHYRQGRTTFDARTLDGAHLVAGLAPVGGTGWFVVVGRPHDALVSQVRASVSLVLLAGLFCAGLGIGAALFLSRAMSRQLRTVVAAHVAGRPPGPAAVVKEVADLAVALEDARTHATRAEGQLEVARGEAMARLEERSEMLDVLAHEVRQPLNNASAALQAAHAAIMGGSPAESMVRVSRAQDVLADVRACIDNTLAAASLLVGSARPRCIDVDIVSLVDVVVRDLALDERSRLRIERATPTRTALMDPHLMRLAIRNLVSNALKFSPTSAEVVIRISDLDDPLALVIDVIDAGPGIEPDLLPGLFDRGTQPGGASVGRRRGLGLFIVRRVMDAHRGSVQVMHSSAAGTTVRLVVDQAVDPAADA